MNTSPNHEKARVSVHRPLLLPTLMHILTWLLAVCALITGALLLLSDIFSFPWPHAPISATPLVLIGAAYLAFQVLTGPTLLDLCKALIVSCAFILWGADQLLPPGWFAATLGEVVIVLYVIDLGWMLLDRLRERKREKMELEK